MIAAPAQHVVPAVLLILGGLISPLQGLVMALFLVTSSVMFVALKSNTDTSTAAMVSIGIYVLSAGWAYIIL